jgi:hypothetical protein
LFRIAAAFHFNAEAICWAAFCTIKCRMPLTMRPTWPTHDWTVFDDEVEIGRIYEDAVATHTRWFWTLGGKAGQAFQLGLVGTGRAATVEEAVAAFKMAYEQWLARRDSDSASA